MSSSRHLFVSATLVLVAWTLPLAQSAEAGSLLVLQVDRTDDDGSADGCLDEVANDCSLRGAIHLANQAKVGVEIELPAGLFELTMNGASEDFNVTGDLDIRRNLTIRGQGAAQTIISGGELATLDDRLVEVHAPDRVVNFESLAFVDGAPPSGLHSVFVGSTNTVSFTDCAFSGHGDEITGGGAVRLAFGVTLATFRDCAFSGNRATDAGAAISSGAETLILRTNSFLGNVSDDFGGALYLESTGLGPSSISISSCDLQDNQSRRGGAVWAGEDTDITISNTTFRDNLATSGAQSLRNSPHKGLFNSSAAAIYTASSLAIDDSTFAGNQAEQDASAIVAESLSMAQSQIDVFNSTFSGNTGLADSLAAVRIVDSIAEFLHVTFAGNDLDLSTSETDLTLQNNAIDSGCVISLGTFQSGGGNVYPNVSCVGGDLDPSDLFATDLALGPLAANGGPTWTHLPDEAGPVFGAAPVCPEFDQRGLRRPASDCASGSVEPQGEIFNDGFESGNTAAWTQTSP